MQNLRENLWFSLFSFTLPFDSHLTLHPYDFLIFFVVKGSSIYTITSGSAVNTSSSTLNYPYAPPLTPDADGMRHIRYADGSDSKGISTNKIKFGGMIVPFLNRWWIAELRSSRCFRFHHNFRDYTSILKKNGRLVEISFNVNILCAPTSFARLNKRIQRNKSLNYRNRLIV